MSGRLTSSTTASGESRALARASLPVAASTTAKPAERSIRDVVYRVAGLSSTTRMVTALASPMSERLARRLRVGHERDGFVTRQSHRYREEEGGPGARLAVDAHPAAEQLRELPAQREAQPGPAQTLLNRRVELHEVVEERGLMFPGDADAGVGHRERDHADTVIDRGNANGALGRELERIGHEVAQYL